MALVASTISLLPHLAPIF
ncbi:hypothetical protein RDABS01_028903 [Bienertia sinuspersici]